MRAASQVDQDELCEALRALGMWYGAKLPPAAALAGTAEEAEAIRAYIMRERPHLTASYDLETLVRLVRAARAARADGVCALERFGPV